MKSAPGRVAGKSEAPNTMSVNKEIATPLYSQIKTLILRSIESGEFRAGEKIPSEMELAAKYGVSRITTKQALNELMQEGVVYRVAGKGTFVKEPTRKTAARGGADLFAEAAEETSPAQSTRGRMASVGLILPYLNDSYEMGIISGVERELRRQDCNLVLRKSDNSAEEETKAVEALRAEGVQGLIIFPAEGMYCSEALLRLKLDRFPFVLVDRYYQGIDTNNVVSDNFGGACAAGRHLLELGHRAIGLVGYTPENVISINYRIKGFNQALAEAGVSLPASRMELKLEREQVYNHRTGQADPSAIEAIRDYLRRNPDLTAVFAINDYTAICVLKAALSLGLSVPGDLSIVGFDNNILAANVDVPLTTVNQPKEALGKSAAQLLLRAFENTQATEKIVLQADLIVRASTAPPARRR